MRWAVWALVAAAFVQPLGWLLSETLWIADLLCHFREPGLVTSLAAVVGALALGRRGVAAGLVAIAAMQGYALTGYGGPPPVRPLTADPGAPPLRLLMANVLYNNRQLDDLVEFIRRERPDILGIVEFSPECGEALRAVRDDFPFRCEVPTGTSGLALWCRRPPRTLGPPEYPVPGRNPVIHASFEYAEGIRHLWLVHPTSPLWRPFEGGNPEIHAIATAVDDQGGSRIVMGDFNTTEASAHFRAFVRKTGLRDTRLGFGRQPSWPTMQPYRIAIDHAFVSDDLAVVDRRLGPMIGSDHFPIVLELAPAAGSPVDAMPPTSRSASADQSTAPH